MDKRNEILDYLYSALISSTQCQVDVKYHSCGTSVVYNLDYSSFFSGIWPETQSNSLYDALSGEFYEELITQENLPFSPAITSLTFLEILESFYSRIEEAKARRGHILDLVSKVHSNINYIRDMPHTGNVKFPLQKIQMESEVNRLYDICGGTLGKSVGRLHRLVGVEGSIVGVGDLVSSGISSIPFCQGEIDSMFDDMWQYRSSRDQRASNQEKEFRYMVDVINIYIQKQLNRLQNFHQFMYVSKASYTSKFCPEDGRTPLVPLFWLKLMKRQDFLNDEERIRFFSAMENSASFVYDRFMARIDVPQPDDYNHGLLSMFNSQYMEMLEVVKALPDYQVSGDDRLFTDKHYVRRELDKNIDQSESALRNIINDFGGVYTDDLIERGGFERLEYFHSVLAKLDRLTKGRH